MHKIFDPLDLLARLAALVPKPRVNLTRFHGVFAPNSKHRALVPPPWKEVVEQCQEHIADACQAGKGKQD